MRLKKPARRRVCSLCGAEVARWKTEKLLDMPLSKSHCPAVGLRHVRKLGVSDRFDIIKMVGEHLYETIRDRYGQVASWAVWEPVGNKPKSNMGPQNVFNLKANPLLLETLRNDIVMVGLNFAHHVERPYAFTNFHSQSPYANDFKIRYAFWDTPYYGAYMTDVLKNLVIPDVRGVRDYIKSNPRVAESHVRAFADELNDLQSEKPLLLVFGRDAYELLNRCLHKSRYSVLILLTHYSHRVPKEKYRDEVLSRIFEVTRAANETVGSKIRL